jgi:hypothetical protein
MLWWKDYKRGRNARLADERKRVARDRLDAAAAVATIQVELDRPWRTEDAFYYRIPWNDNPTILPMEAAVKPTQEQLEKVYEAAKMVVMELDCAESLRSGPPTTTPGESALWAAVRAAAQPRWTVTREHCSGVVTTMRQACSTWAALRINGSLVDLASATVLERIARLLNADDAKRGQP